MFAPPLLAHSAGFGLVLIIVSFLLMLIGLLWMLGAALERGILWFLGCLFVPLVPLILIIVEPKARPSFVTYFIGVGIFVWALIGLDIPNGRPMGPWDRLSYVFSSRNRSGAGSNRGPAEKPAPASTADRPPSLGARTERLRGWQMDLERKRAAVNPNDAAAVADFSRELNAYKVELEQMKADAAKAGP